MFFQLGCQGRVFIFGSIPLLNSFLLLHDLDVAVCEVLFTETGTWLSVVCRLSNYQKFYYLGYLENTPYLYRDWRWSSFEADEHPLVLPSLLALNVDN